MGMNISLIFLSHRAVLMGIFDEAWLLSSFSIFANTIDRLIGDWFHRWANRLAIYNTRITLSGIATVPSFFLCYTFISVVSLLRGFLRSLIKYVILLKMLMVTFFAF